MNSLDYLRLPHRAYIAKTNHERKYDVRYTETGSVYKLIETQNLFYSLHSWLVFKSIPIYTHINRTAPSNTRSY